MLDVVDGEAERLVSLEEAVEDLGADRADARARAARGELAVEVVLGEGGLQGVEHLAQRFEPLSQTARVSRSRWPAMRRKRVRASSAVSINSR